MQKFANVNWTPVHVVRAWENMCFIELKQILEWANVKLKKEAEEEAEF